MQTKEIPLIITNFNQLTYLDNTIRWFRWYNPENPVVILDNASDYEPLLEYYDHIHKVGQDIELRRFADNKSRENLRAYLLDIDCDYYIVSDPDLQPHPNIPPNYLQIYKHILETTEFNRIGFDLITESLPHWLADRGEIKFNEEEIHKTYDPLVFDYNEGNYVGFRTPIDTTFALYKKEPGWYSPMTGEDWSMSIRMFYAFHLGWYIHPDHVNPEMDHYFRSAKFREAGCESAGLNNNRPQKYKE